MITHTNNNRALFLAGIDLWLRRPDVREMHYSEHGLNVRIVVPAAALETGEVNVAIGEREATRVTIAQLRASVVGIFEGESAEVALPPAESRGGAEDQAPGERTTQLMLL